MAAQIRDLVPFLDPQVLLYLLKNVAPKATAKVQEQLMSKAIGPKKEEAAQKEAEALDLAKVAFKLLGDLKEVDRLRQEKHFTLDYLQENHHISISDIRRLFGYAKVLYD